MVHEIQQNAASPK